MERQLDTPDTIEELHETWLAEIAEELAPIFDGSSEGVYVFLDDRHKICNAALAKMWGFASARDWAATPDFLNSFVVEADRAAVSRSYHEHIHGSLTPARLRFAVRRPDGEVVRCETDMIPLAHAGQMFAYHFVRMLPAGRDK